MASRGFYLVSTTLLGATALLAWLALPRESHDSPTPAPDSAPTTIDDRALGVRAAEYDAARTVSREDPASLTRQRTGSPTMIPVPPRPRPGSEDLAPPGPPLAGSPELNAASEASAAAQEQVIAAVRADLESRRDDLRKSCWPQGSDAAATFAVHADYAADGTLLSLAVPDVHGLPGVGACLVRQIGQKPPPLPEPPGVAVAVAVPLAFAGSQTLPPRPPAQSMGKSSSGKTGD